MKEIEHNMIRDDFEQMLKDTTDDFRMYPSRKIWHSIYNNLHPDRKWPSLAVCLLLLTAILYIGVSNNNNISKESRNLLASSLNSETTNSTIKEKNVLSNINKQNNIHTAATISNITNIIKPSINVSGIDHNISIAFLKANQEKSSFKNIFLEADLNAKNKTKEDNDISYIDNAIPVNDKNQKKNEQEIANNTMSNSKINTKDSYAIPEEEKALKNSLTGVNNTKISEDQKTNPSKINETEIVKTNNINIEEKAWVEDYAFHNLYRRNKWKTNLAIEYYITPSIGYRQLYKNNDFEPASGLLQRTTDNNDVLSQQAAFNFEAGTSFQLKLNKRVRLKIGLQLNYTNYITNAHQLDHPTQTTVLMNNIQNGNLMPVDYNSFYGNIQGSNIDKLNNYTIQISTPLGLDYKLLGSNKIKWYVGASIQPTYVIGGNANLISSNYKNYASDPTMLRDWNFNTSIESFISIKTPGDIFINVGPQLRYQLLSSYSNQYSYSENLYNVGLKLGITKKL